MNLFESIGALAEAKIDYVVVGGLAVALRGYQRVTMDVDIVLAMNAGNLQRFMDCARACGLQPTIPVPLDSLTRPEQLEQLYREKGVLTFGLRGPDMTAPVIDVLVKPVVPFAELKRDATVVEVGSLHVPVASIDHLIAMKTGTGRSKDAIDIEELRKIRDGLAR